MFARVTQVQAPPERVDSGIDSFKNQVVPAVKGVDGFKGALLLVDRSTGKGIGITLWESEDARRRGADAVDEARSATLKAMGGGSPPVEEYEVAVAEL